MKSGNVSQQGAEDAYLWYLRKKHLLLRLWQMPRLWETLLAGFAGLVWAAFPGNSIETLMHDGRSGLLLKIAGNWWIAVLYAAIYGVSKVMLVYAWQQARTKEIRSGEGIAWGDYEMDGGWIRFLHAAYRVEDAEEMMSPGGRIFFRGDSYLVGGM